MAIIFALYYLSGTVATDNDDWLLIYLRNSGGKVANTIYDGVHAAASLVYITKWQVENTRAGPSENGLEWSSLIWNLRIWCAPLTPRENGVPWKWHCPQEGKIRWEEAMQGSLPWKIRVGFIARSQLIQEITGWIGLKSLYGVLMLQVTTQ